MKLLSSSLLLASLLVACGEPKQDTPDGPPPADLTPPPEQVDPPDETPDEMPDEMPAPEPSNDAEALSALLEHCAELPTRPEKDVNQVEVQHLLVSFAGTGTPATRSKQEAELLAAQLWARIAQGEDFDALVKEYTDDSYPGTYMMVSGTATKPPGAYRRNGMVPAFGNVGWRLEVGEFGVADFNPSKSPYGWHIVKRTQ